MTDPNAAMNIPSSGAANSCTAPMNTFNPACIINTGPWTLNAAEVASYSANLHQCVQVSISSNPGSNTIILNNSATQKMNIGMASTMQSTAEISARGYKLPPGKGDQHFDLGIQTKSEFVKARDKGSALSQLTWEAHGCRHTNNFVLVGQQKIELCESVGAFGYIVQHRIRYRR